MSEEPNLPAVAASLFAKLYACDLTPDERTLLDTILGPVKKVIGPDSTFAAEFAVSFEPGPGAPSPSPPSSSTHSITNTIGPTSITCTTTTTATPPSPPPVPSL
ncbi:hypothetical protein EV186_11138 [Labedaea rhizosphaerae]|uniref:Uncharacterized protein n=1 Tax=Labedaea rhizosphaerae TaxID=598644 RepID=A0A4R6RSW9_LABRH|nr:hypothetical protein EV186_11138 [Labedaea rhizosphaerae]